MIKRIKDNIIELERWSGINNFSMPLSQKLDDCFLLSARARGGSTFVSKVLNHSNKMLEIFEPFNSDEVDISNNLQRPSYYTSNYNNPELYSELESILLGKNRNKWTQQFQSRKPYLYRKTLIKAIRCNLLLPYICEQFPTVKVVFLMRNPFAQITSLIKSRFKIPKNYFKILMKNDDFIQDYGDHLDVEHVRNLSTDNLKEFYFHMWCIETIVGLSQNNRQNYFVTTYESFVRNDESVIKLLNKLGVHINIKRYDAPFNKLSKSAWFGDADYTNNSDFLNKWKKHWSKDEIKLCDNLLETYGLSDIYSSKHDLPVDEIYKNLENRF